MKPRTIVVRQVLAQHRSQVLLIDNNHIIQSLSPQGAYHSLGDGVRPGCLGRREYGLNPKAGWSCVEAPSIEQSRARTRSFGCLLQGVASISCRHTHSAVG